MLNVHSEYDHVGCSAHTMQPLLIVLRALHLRLSLEASGIVPIACCHVACMLRLPYVNVRVLLFLACVINAATVS